MTFSVVEQIFLSRLCQVIFFFPLFFALSCTKSGQEPSSFTRCLTSEEKRDLQTFFQYLLFDNYGAYVLLGSKPLCELSVHNMDSPAVDEAFQKFWERLTDEEREKIKEAKRKSQAKRNAADLDAEMDLESSRYRGWLAFQKLTDRFKLKGFLFRATPTLRPDTYDILFINIQQTAMTLADNYEVFKKATGMDFHPLQAVFEAQEPSSLFWTHVMALENHMAKGLLFGFGHKNALFGEWVFSSGSGSLNMPNEKYRQEIESFLEQSMRPVSTDVVPKGDFSLHIPLFGIVSGDEMAEKYGKERAVIESTYRNKDMVEVTLSLLLTSKFGH